MITTELTDIAGPLWSRIAGDALVGAPGPHVAVLPDGVLQLEAKVEHGLMLAIFSAVNRELEAWEEEELKIACKVPAFAERVPMTGQERRSRYRRGIVDTQPRRMVTYWWSLEEDPHGT